MTKARIVVYNQRTPKAKGHHKNTGMYERQERTESFPFRFWGNVISIVKVGSPRLHAAKSYGQNRLIRTVRGTYKFHVFKIDSN